MKFKNLFKLSIVTSIILSSSFNVFALPKHNESYINYTITNIDLDDINVDELWDKFLTATANEKLLDIKSKKLKEDNILLKPKERELFYYLSMQNKEDYSEILTKQYDIEQTEYELKSKKELYKLEKKQAEQLLKSLGEIKDKRLLEYELYYSKDYQVEEYSDILNQQLNIKSQIEDIKFSQKELEYKYMLENITDDEFISLYKDLEKQKQILENSSKVIDAKIKNFNIYTQLR